MQRYLILRLSLLLQTRNTVLSTKIFYILEMITRKPNLIKRATIPKRITCSFTHIHYNFILFTYEQHGMPVQQI